MPDGSNGKYTPYEASPACACSPGSSLARCRHSPGQRGQICSRATAAITGGIAEGRSRRSLSHLLLLLWRWLRLSLSRSSSECFSDSAPRDIWVITGATHWTGQDSSGGCEHALTHSPSVSLSQLLIKGGRGQDWEQDMLVHTYNKP